MATAGAFGLQAEACKLNIGLLSSSVPLEHAAVIAHLSRGHFALVEGVCEERVTLWNPSEQDMEMTIREFRGAWDGVSIVLARPQGSSGAPSPFHCTAP